MAYISTEEVAEIRAKLKAEFPLKAGWKFNVRREHHSSIMVEVVRAPKRFNDAQGVVYMDDYMQINPYWYHEHFDTESKAVLDKMFSIIKEKWWDESDSQIDYFHTAFYFSLHFGRWNKGCEWGGAG